MQAENIENYLSQLGQELINLGVHQPIRVLMIGGAYMMLLAKSPRSTDDVDIFWLEDEQTLQQALRSLQDGVHTVAKKNALEPNWLNYLTQLLMYDQITIPKGKLWRQYGPLHIYVPPKEYILALKILAGREKDIDDCKLLLQQVKVQTRQQAQRLLKRYILPSAQKQNAEQIENSLDELFGKL
jgi:predicted nucleotidyltransferase